MIEIKESKSPLKVWIEEQEKEEAFVKVEAEGLEEREADKIVKMLRKIRKKRKRKNGGGLLFVVDSQKRSEAKRTSLQE